MTAWKKIVLISASFGAGVVIILALILGGFVLYSKTKPWNKNAITAKYDRLRTEGDDNTLCFHYILTNNTTSDYSIIDNKYMIISAKLKRQDSLLNIGESLTVEIPIFVPTKQRMMVDVYLGPPNPYTGEPLPINATEEERKKYEEQLKSFLNEKIPNLNGFVIHDMKNHYQIEFPKGW